MIVQDMTKFTIVIVLLGVVLAVRSFWLREMPGASWSGSRSWPVLIHFFVLVGEGETGAHDSLPHPPGRETGGRCASRGVPP